jgi:hypothetical protein
MDKSTVSGSFSFVLYAFETSGYAANAGKFVEFFISNPAQPLHFVSTACGFVLHCLEPKARSRNLAKTPSASNRFSFPVLLDVAGRDNE